MTIRHDQDGTSAGTKESERGVGSVEERSQRDEKYSVWPDTQGQGKGEMEKTLVMSCHGRTDSAGALARKGI